MEYADTQNEIEDMREPPSPTTSVVTFPKNIEANGYQARPTDSTIAVSSAFGAEPNPRCTLWDLEKEEIFLDVWEKYLGDLAHAKIKLSVYKNMEAELESKGVKMSCYNIETKIESFIRKFW